MTKSRKIEKQHTQENEEMLKDPTPDYLSDLLQTENLTNSARLNSKMLLRDDGLRYKYLKKVTKLFKTQRVSRVVGKWSSIYNSRI